MTATPVSTDLVQVKIFDMHGKEIIVSCHPLIASLIRRQNREIDNYKQQLSDLQNRLSKLSLKGS